VFKHFAKQINLFAVQAIKCSKGTIVIANQIAYFNFCAKRRCCLVNLSYALIDLQACPFSLKDCKSFYFFIIQKKLLHILNELNLKKDYQFCTSISCVSKMKICSFTFSPIGVFHDANHGTRE
jgi:hypothetical protein